MRLMPMIDEYDILLSIILPSTNYNGAHIDVKVGQQVGVVLDRLSKTYF